MYKNTFNKVPPTFGVGEWAGYSYNCGIGCSHNCRYCYARSFFVKNKIVGSNADWTAEQPKPNKIDIKYKVDKRVMFPSTHDITPAYLDTYCKALSNILEAGNDVLLVSKPHMECIKHICAEFAAFKNQMEFRFTIGSLCPDVTSFWEPGAPLPEERIRCLQYATDQGYKTSVSMEPMLEGKDSALLAFYELAPITTGTIWIGMMNYLDERVAATDKETVVMIEKVKQLQSRDEILILHSQLCHEPKVRWKESIRNLIQ